MDLDLTAPDSHLYFETRGDGIPLFLLHGAPVDHRCLLPLEEGFTAIGGWHRYYPDLPGFGRSRAPVSIDSSLAVAKSVISFIKAQVGDRPFALLGSSYGGMIARYVAGKLSDQVLGLALLAPVVVAKRTARTLPPRTILEQDDALLASLDPSDREEFAGVSVNLTREGWDRFREAVLPGLHSYDPVANTRIETNYALPRQPEEEFGPLTKPTLILAGRLDSMVGFEDQFALAKVYPKATYVALATAGHNLQLDEPALVHATVAAWLRRVRASALTTAGDAPVSTDSSGCGSESTARTSTADSTASAQ